MFGFFKKKVSSNQVDLYISGKIQGVAGKFSAVVEANNATIVDSEAVLFLAAGLFMNATYINENGKKSEAIRIKVIGFVKYHLDAGDDKKMLESLSDSTRWFTQGNMFSHWFINQFVGDVCGAESKTVYQQILSNEALDILVNFFQERTDNISNTLNKEIYPYYTPS